MKWGLSPLNYIDSWQFAKSAFQFISRNKDLNIFPLLVLSCTLLFLAFVSGIFDHFNVDGALTYVILLFLYFTLSFITIYFNAVIAAITLKRLNQESATIAYGFRIAHQQLKAILYWTLIASTIGLIARVVESLQNIVEKIIGYSFGFTWSLATYFLLPVLIVEKVGPLKAVRRSIDIVGKGFKNTVSVKALFTIFLIVLLLTLTEFLTTSPVALTNMVILILPICLMLFSLATTLETIVSCALYLNAQQRTVEGFDKSLLDRAFVKNFNSYW